MLGLSIKTKDVIGYATMPRVIPRLKGLASSGFGYIAFLMASIYHIVRLLPANHPYLQPENIGRFGVQNVIVEAANRLEFSRKNIDQFIVFVAMLAAVVILLLQILFLVYAVFIGPAMAFSFFDTPNPTNDLAYSILNDVFGIHNLYCSSFTGVCAANNPPAVPLPYHNALHELFRFYSTALLLIGTLIFLYFIFVIILETAVSGKPFGQRFQNVWVPIRLIMAIGLLIPINYGLNSGQYIVLYVAKYASNFATVGWNDFNLAIALHPHFAGGAATDGRPIGERYSMIAIPEEVDITPVVQAMSLVHACAYSYMLMTANTVGASAGWTKDDDYTDPATGFFIRPYLVKNLSPWMTAAANFPVPVDNNTRRQILDSLGSTDYLEALGFYYGGDIIIRFGEYKEVVPGSGIPAYKEEVGNVKPLCGDIRIPVVDLSDPGGAGAGRGGADHMLMNYYDMILQLWFDDVEMQQFARTYVTLASKNSTFVNPLCSNAGLSGCGTPGFQACGAPCRKNPPPSEFKSMKITKPGGWQGVMNAGIRSAWGNYARNGLNMNMEANIIDRGWAGAGIWYNKIAEMNGAFINAVRALPTMDKFPLVMEQIRKERQKADENSFSSTEMFKPSIKAGSGKDAANLKVDGGAAVLNQVGVPLYNVWTYWNDDRSNVDNEEETVETNIFLMAMNMVLGTSGIANIRGSNAHIHPLAQLVAVGKGLVDSAVINLVGSTGMAFLGGLFKPIQKAQGFAAASEMASGILEVTAFVGLTAGFVLYYVLPFLPFVYFFFAVGSWVKAIFEAMVGTPLWALAHLRIDGEGLPGDAAQNGYFLILEIFIRPILSVVGLIAAILIFSVQVRVLNLIWDLVTINATGYSDSDIMATIVPTDMNFKRDAIDQFFFTIIYTIVCYMLAVASFKLIDRIPDNILRWAGAGVSAFGDMDQDHVDSLNRYAATGGMTIGSQATSAIRSGSSGIGESLTKLVTSEKGSAG